MSEKLHLAQSGYANAVRERDTALSEASKAEKALRQAEKNVDAKFKVLCKVLEEKK